jgi:hypothetical protein
LPFFIPCSIPIIMPSFFASFFCKLLLQASLNILRIFFERYRLHLVRPYAMAYRAPSRMSRFHATFRYLCGLPLMCRTACSFALSAIAIIGAMAKFQNNDRPLSSFAFHNYIFIS